MIPIAPLSENQTWRHGEYSVYVHFEGDRINAWLMTVGRDGDLPANPAEADRTSRRPQLREPLRSPAGSLLGWVVAEEGTDG